MKKLLAYMLMFAFVFALVGCGGGGNKNAPESIEITGPLTVEVGKTIQLTAKVNPDKADQTVKWESLKPEYASVSDTGLVTGKKEGLTVIRAVSTVNDAVFKTYSVKVTNSGAGEARPNLQGYTISIAQAAHALYEQDPFLDEYTGLDKAAKQKAWEWVEKAYNCTIQVVAYPQDAEWGEPRWKYIEQKAADKVADYDFYTVPDSKIGRFVDAGALIDITDWYALYGQNYMDPVYRISGSYDGKLYSITNGESGIYNVMYYNINLLDELNMEFTPAELFNRGEWTYSKFKEYAIAAQAKLDEKGDGYWAVAGNSPYYWVGMANAGGVKLADVTKLDLDLKNPISIAAAETLKAIKTAGAMDEVKQIDGGVVSWNEAKALFCSGDLWFVNTSNRWKEDLWGTGDLTKYGYVPFPRPDGTDLSDQKIGLGGTATYVMPIGRDYSAYGPECTAENIYRAMADLFLKTKEFLLNDPNYNEDVYRRQVAEKYTESEDSIQAFIWMSSNIKNIGFYDPLSTADNPIINTGYGDFSNAVNNYIFGQIETFAEAVDEFLPVLKENLVKAYT